jgi:hypothetical protein
VQLLQTVEYLPQNVRCSHCFTQLEGIKQSSTTQFGGSATPLDRRPQNAITKSLQTRLQQQSYLYHITNSSTSAQYNSLVEQSSALLQCVLLLQDALRALAKLCAPSVKGALTLALQDIRYQSFEGLHGIAALASTVCAQP